MKGDSTARAVDVIIINAANSYLKHEVGGAVGILRNRWWDCILPQKGIANIRNMGDKDLKNCINAKTV